MYNVSLPWWSYALMGAGLVVFLGLLTLSVKRNHGVKRSLFASPYILWMILFTLLPCVLIAYYALTDGSGQLTMDNFRAFWDSNHIMRENMRAVVRGRGGRHHSPGLRQRGYAGLLPVDGVPVHGYFPAAGLSGGAVHGRPAP